MKRCLSRTNFVPLLAWSVVHLQFEPSLGKANRLAGGIQIYPGYSSDARFETRRHAPGSSIIILLTKIGTCKPREKGRQFLSRLPHSRSCDSKIEAQTDCPRRITREMLPCWLMPNGRKKKESTGRRKELFSQDDGIEGWIGRPINRALAVSSVEPNSLRQHWEATPPTLSMREWGPAV